ncbi:MAG: hypothetical protein ACJA11_002353 [Glaciecola sp.]|jgi:hypothetical protein
MGKIIKGIHQSLNGAKANVKQAPKIESKIPFDQIFRS